MIQSLFVRKENVFDFVFIRLHEPSILEAPKRYERSALSESFSSVAGKDARFLEISVTTSSGLQDCKESICRLFGRFLI